MNIIGYKNKISIVLILSLIMSLLTSCNKVKIVNSKDLSIEEYTKGAIMVLVADEKNKYETRFGRDIWNLKSGDGERNYSDQVVSDVKTFVEKIYDINNMSKRYNIAISHKDEELLEKLASEYYNNLSSQDLTFMETTKEDVLKMYKDFHNARLTVDHITKNAKVELSISEAKVIKVQFIELEDYNTAFSVSTRSQARGANFAYFAKQYTTAKGSIERVVMRGDDFANAFPEIFYLSTGQISEVLEHDGKYYVFKCINDYMVDETQKRKKDIVKKIKEDAFNEEFERFENENAIKLSAPYWKEIDLKDGFDCTVNNFYNLYYTYFPVSDD